MTFLYRKSRDSTSKMQARRTKSDYVGVNLYSVSMDVDRFVKITSDYNYLTQRTHIFGIIPDRQSHNDSHIYVIERLFGTFRSSEP